MGRRDLTNRVGVGHVCNAHRLPSVDHWQAANGMGAHEPHRLLEGQAPSALTPVYRPGV